VPFSKEVAVLCLRIESIVCAVSMVVEVVMNGFGSSVLETMELVRVITSPSCPSLDTTAVIRDEDFKGYSLCGRAVTRSTRESVRSGTNKCEFFWD